MDGLCNGCGGCETWEPVVKIQPSPTLWGPATYTQGDLDGSGAGDS